MRARPIRSFSPRSSSHHAGDEAASKATSSLELQHHGEACGPYAPASARYGAGDSLGVLGFVAAIFLTVFAAYGLLDAAGVWAAIPVGAACVAVAVCGVVRGPLRYGEQLCNHSRIQDSRARAR